MTIALGLGEQRRWRRDDQESQYQTEVAAMKPDNPQSTKPDKPPKPPKETITVVVNGNPTEVAANLNAPLRTLVNKALDQTGNAGQPPESWELRDAQGVVLDLEKKIGDYQFPPDVKLFLSLKAGVGG